jgi:hypothetical protein
MTDSIRLGRIAGVNVGLHWSLLLIGGLLAAGLARGPFPAAAPGYSGAAYALAAGVSALAFLGSVLAHELSHTRSSPDERASASTASRCGSSAASRAWPRSPRHPGRSSRSPEPAPSPASCSVS